MAGKRQDGLKVGHPSADMRQYAVGDVVLLKSSPMPMTIDKILPDGVCVCLWFNSAGDLKANGFQPASLQPRTQEKP